MKRHWNGPSPVGKDTLAVSLTELRRIAGVNDDEQLRIGTLLYLVEGYYLELPTTLFSKCSWIGGHHGCKERLARVSQRFSLGAQGQLAKPERATSRLCGRLKRKMSHSAPTQSSVIFVRNEGAVRLGQKLLRRQKRNKVFKQPQEIKHEDSKRSQASSSQFTKTEKSTRGSEQVSENTPMTEVMQSFVVSDQRLTQSSYRSGESQSAA